MGFCHRDRLEGARETEEKEECRRVFWPPDRYGADGSEYHEEVDIDAALTQRLPGAAQSEVGAACDGEIGDPVEVRDEDSDEADAAKSREDRLNIRQHPGPAARPWNGGRIVAATHFSTGVSVLWSDEVME